MVIWFHKILVKKGLAIIYFLTREISLFYFFQEFCVAFSKDLLTILTLKNVFTDQDFVFKLLVILEIGFFDIKCYCLPNQVFFVLIEQDFWWLILQNLVKTRYIRLFQRLSLFYSLPFSRSMSWVCEDFGDISVSTAERLRRCFC